MHKLTIIFLFFTYFLNAQLDENYLNDFLLESKLLKSKNELNTYHSYNFSDIWTVTKNNFVLGVIGKEHQRIKIKLISIVKNIDNPDEYYVMGKSNVKGTICDFIGKITLKEIRVFKKLHFGIDNEYAGNGIRSQGILIAEYLFKEDLRQNHSGLFSGNLYSKWYLNSENKIQYDDIESISDGYINNAFIGIWKNYSSEKGKICNWGDYRVPNANPDFDIGAGEFSPSPKYYSKGWANYWTDITYEWWK